MANNIDVLLIEDLEDLKSENIIQLTVLFRHMGFEDRGPGLPRIAKRWQFEKAQMLESKERTIRITLENVGSLIRTMQQNRQLSDDTSLLAPSADTSIADVIKKLKYSSIFITERADHMLKNANLKDMVHENAGVLSMLDSFWLPKEDVKVALRASLTSDAEEVIPEEEME